MSRPQRHRDRIIALLWEVGMPSLEHAPPRAAPPGGPPRRDPGDTTPAASAAPSSALASCCARASTTRSGRCTATSASARLGRPGLRAGRGGAATRRRAYAYLIYPHKPIVAYLPQTASCSASTASPSRTRRAPTAARGCPTPTTRWPSGWPSRARGAAGRPGQHAPARPPGGPQQVRRDLWRLPSGSEPDRRAQRRAARQGGTPRREHARRRAG